MFHGMRDLSSLPLQHCRVCLGCGANKLAVLELHCNTDTYFGTTRQTEYLFEVLHYQQICVMGLHVKQDTRYKLHKKQKHSGLGLRCNQTYLLRGYTANTLPLIESPIEPWWNHPCP